MKSKVSIVKCHNYNSSEVEGAVRRSLDLIGGVTAFIKPKSKVLLKPNLLAARGPESGIDTHPTVVRAMIRVLKDIDCKIYLGDGPSVWAGEAEDIENVFELSGMKKVAEDEGIELVKFNRQRWHGKFPLTTWIDECDHVVSLPKLKTHDLMVLTGAIKNLYGCVTGLYKTELHKRYFAKDEFAKILVDIFEKAKPCLTVVDGIVAMEGEGPGSAGELRNLGLLFAGSDCVAIDSVLAKIMGLSPLDILSTKEAARRNLGTSDLSNIEILGEKLEDLSVKPFKLPATSIYYKIPKPLVNVLKKLLHFYPRIHPIKCVRCQDCVRICPGHALSLKNNKIVLDRRKCVSCFCCNEACTHAAISIKKSLLAKLIGI